MIVNAVRKRRLPVPSSGGGLINFIYLDDAAAATVAALEKGNAGQAYNIVDDEPVRWADYLDALAAESGRVGLGGCRPGCCGRSPTSTRYDHVDARLERQGQTRPGWAPAVSTYRDGIALMVRASR